VVQVYIRHIGKNSDEPIRQLEELSTGAFEKRRDEKDRFLSPVE
jgi:hypothetical protein